MASNLSNEDLMQKTKETARKSKSRRKVSKKKYKLPKGHYELESLLDWHQHLLDDTPLASLAPSMTTHDPISCSKLTVFGRQDLKKYENSYTPIKIRDLAPGVVYRERIVYAKTIVDFAIRASLHTVIEDESKGGGYCKLCVYNLMKENEFLFTKGTKLAILNPYYKSSNAGKCFMRVDNPMEVIVMEVPWGPGGSTPSLLPIQHKERGNELFREKRLPEAAEAYSLAIMGDPRDPFFYSNRSLCYIKLGEFESALSDATTACEMVPDEDKFKYRASMAWSGLGDHQRALELLRQLISSSQDNVNTTEYQNKLDIELVYLSQERGDLNLEGIEAVALAGLPVQMADFIGLLELRESGMSGCAERGLFATRDIKQGEVIHVSKAAVFLDCFKDKISDIMELCPEAMSPPFLVLVSKLIQEMNKSKLFAHRVLNIMEDERFSKKSPFYTDIQLYTGSGFELVKDLPPLEFSVENIRFVAHRKGWSYKRNLSGSTNLCDFGANPDLYRSGGLNYGLWLIPCLFNHSCVCNVVKILKGEVCVLKVFKDVKKGEELLLTVLKVASI